MTRLLLEWVVTASLLILAVIGLRALLGRRISAGLRYALWAVVLIRLLVPLQFFSLPVPAVFPEADKEPITTSAAPTPVHQGEPVGVPAIAAPLPSGVVVNDDFTVAPSSVTIEVISLWDVLGWLWLAGSLVMATAFLISNLVFALCLRRVRIPLEGVDCPLPLYLAESLPSPCLFGLVRPAVYVTADTAQDPAMLRHILAHEHTHFRHGDHLWNVLRSTALAVHWWNPLVWLAVVLSRRDCELACDEGALKRLGDGERIAYGRTLLALITVKPRPGDLLRCSTTMTGGQKSVFDRVTRIARAPKRWLWAAVVAVIVTALACVCAFGQAEALDSEDTLDLTDDEFENFDSEPDLTQPTAPIIDPAAYTLAMDEYGVSVSITGLDCESALWYSIPLHASFHVPKTALGYLDISYPWFLGEEFTSTYLSVTALYCPEGGGQIWMYVLEYNYPASRYFMVDMSTGAVTEQKLDPQWAGKDPIPSDRVLTNAALTLAQLIQEASNFYQASLPAPEEGPLPFDVPMKMEFASGAGGWDTLITLHPDGSFEGDYHDMDMGVTGPGYQSTEYVCRFHGRFGGIQQVTDASWSLTLEELVIDTGHPIGEEWIETISTSEGSYNLRYISSDPYGFDTVEDGPLKPGAQFMFYTPDASGYRPTDELYGFNSANTDYDSVMYQFWTWMPSSHKIGSWGWDTTLGYYALCNMETGYGFFDLEAWGIT